MLGAARPGIEMLKNTTASRKLLVLTESSGSVEAGDYIVRTSTNGPPVFVAGGAMWPPYRGRGRAGPPPHARPGGWRGGGSPPAARPRGPAPAPRAPSPP